MILNQFKVVFAETLLKKQMVVKVEKDTLF